MKMSLTKSDLQAVKKVVDEVFDPKINSLQTTLVGGMNQMVETLINHIDNVEIRLTKKINGVDDNLSNQIADLSRRHDKTLDLVYKHDVRIGKLEGAAK